MNFLTKYYAAITAILVFVLYLFTLAPSVVQIDSGELATVQYRLGIAHPTGYPLFTMMGYLFLLLPLPISKILQANLLAAIWCSAGIFVFIKSAETILQNSSFSLTRNVSSNKDKKVVGATKSLDLRHLSIMISAIFGSGILAFSKTYWQQSTSVEVYSLHIFLINLVIFFLLKSFYIQESKNVYMSWILVSVALALAFSNHMTTILIIPGLAFIFFTKEKFSLISVKKIGVMLLCFFPLLIVIYSYLPIRAMQNPILNWGNPIDFERFFRHFTGKQYQVWLFSSFDSAKEQLIYFITTMPSELTIIGLGFAIIGVVFSFKYARNIFYFLIITFAFTVLYSINYDIVDIDSYFLLAYISLAFFVVFGAFGVITFLSKHKINFKTIGASFILLAVLQFIINFKGAGQSDVYTFEDYTKAVIGSVNNNSVIFSYQWDYLISPSYYFQYAEKYRDDVTIIDKELLRRSWYYNQLERNHPEIVSGISNEINNFLDALRPFERDENFNAQLIEKYYRQIMTGLIFTNIEKRDYFIAPELVENEMRRGEFSLPNGYTIVPHLFLFEVVKGKEYVPAPPPDFEIRFPDNSNHYTDFIKRIVTSMLANRAYYELQNNFPEKAKLYIDKLRNDFPEFKIPEVLTKFKY